MVRIYAQQFDAWLITDEVTARSKRCISVLHAFERVTTKDCYRHRCSQMRESVSQALGWWECEHGPRNCSGLSLSSPRQIPLKLESVLEQREIRHVCRRSRGLNLGHDSGQLVSSQCLVEGAHEIVD